MATRVLSICMLALLILGCSSTKSVYDFSKGQQRGLTYQTYEQNPDEVYEATSTVLKNAEFSNVDDGWDIRSSSRQSGVIETEWKVVDFSQKVDGSDWPSLRYKIKVAVKEKGGGSEVELKLSKERRIMGRQDVESPWRWRTVGKEDAQEYLRPLFKSLSDDHLTTSTG